ncbi:hypothetical protein Ae201684P_008331 [Aphanomyces euteiches]|nr:hypothetical protein Ae201684P_008331 [Aphanomyces euteiches]
MEKQKPLGGKAWLMPNMVSSVFRRVVLHLDGHVLLQKLAFVCQAWRHALLADDELWQAVVAKEFPSTILHPAAQTSWVSVYIGEKTRRFATPSPLRLLPTMDRLAVNLHGQTFDLVLERRESIVLQGDVQWLRKRTFAKHAWHHATMVLGDTAVTLTAKHEAHSIQIHIRDLEVKQERAQVRLIRASFAAIILSVASDDVAAAWTAAVSHNRLALEAKCLAVLHSPVKPTASSLSHLRRFHAFRLTQAIAAANPVRRSSISKDVLLALHGKSPLGMGENVPRLPPDTIPRHPNAKPMRHGTIRRARGALHLVPDPSTIASAIVNDPDTFEGHACAQYINLARTKAPKTPQLCHDQLCKTRDVMANLVDYIMAYRQGDLVRSGGVDSVRGAVYAAVERKICLALAKPIVDWTRKCIPSQAQDKLRRRMQAWSSLPPSSKQFGLLPHLILSWTSVVSRLRAIDAETLPSLKLRHLLDAAKCIFQVFNQSRSDTRDSNALSADDFLPVFIHCLCLSQLKEPLATLEMLWTLCSEESLQGEAGYYLTMMEASLEYIRTAAAVVQDMPGGDR